MFVFYKSHDFQMQRLLKILITMPSSTIICLYFKNNLFQEETFLLIFQKKKIAINLYKLIKTFLN